MRTSRFLVCPSFVLQPRYVIGTVIPHVFVLRRFQIYVVHW